MSEGRVSAPGLRAIRLAERPAVSVVVASSGDRQGLDRGLATLLPPCQEQGIEVVVARACSTQEYRELERAYPAVLFMPAADGSPARQLRVIGFSAAGGDIVSLLEDAVAPDARVSEGGRLAPHVVSVGQPLLSVIMPAHNAVATVRAALEGVAGSTLPREDFEVLLVDDASTDETSLVAAEYCDRVVRLSGRPHGPAFARNRAVEASRGEVLVFVDADVVLHEDALTRIAARFREDATVAALFGSYDDRPPAKGFVSQYRNLLDNYMHQYGAGDAETFWAGIGAIRRQAFLDVGMFDEWHFSKPAIEDAELGRRLRRRNLRIVLDCHVLGTHLKAWTFGELIVSDFRHRGLTWAWLMFKEGTPLRRRLHVLPDEKLLTALAGIAGLAVAAALVLRDGRPLVLALSVAVFIFGAHLDFYVRLARSRGLLFAAASVPMHLLHFVLNAASAVTGAVSNALLGEPMPPADLTARAQLGVATWPPPPRRSDQSIWEQPPDPGPR